jgi:ABC-type multidrug transport system ATPase subunit
VTTHFLEETDYCDRVSFIESGRLVADATPEALRARFSHGYRVRCAPAPERLEGALAELAAAGFSVEAAPPGSAELVLRRPALGAPALEALRRALGADAAARLRIEPASMNEVFRRLIETGEAARREAA